MAKKKSTYSYLAKKQKSNIYPIAALIILILAVVVIAFLLSTKKQELPIITVPNITKSEKNNSIICDDDCMLKNAIQAKSAAACDTIINKSKKQDCHSQLAPDVKDACLRSENYTQKKSCVNSYALSFQDVAICRTLNESDSRDCIEKVDPCYYTNYQDKPLCKALNKQDYSLCNKDFSCLLSFALKTNSTNACSDISVRYQQNACRSIILGTDSCVDLPLTDEINICRELYAEKANYSLECGFIQSDTVYSVNCYAFFAEQTKNPKLCDGVALLQRWDCYKKYALDTGDPLGCDSIDQFVPIFKEHCFIDLAKQYANPQACEYLSFDTGAKDVCFRAAIQDNSNLRHDKCSNLTNYLWGPRCYTNAAKLERNISACNLQQNPDDVQFCRDNYK